MDERLYVKVYLYAYPQLEGLAEAESRSAENRALLSFRGASGALEAAEKVVESIFAARELLALKADLDGCLSLLSEEERFLLEYKYFRRRSALGARAERVFGCSERSYFRKQNAVLNKTAACLISRGRTERDFLERFGDYSLFMRVYRALAEGRERAVVFKRKRRGIRFAGQNSSCGEGERFPLKTSTATARHAAAITQITAICTPEGPSAAGGCSSPPLPETSSR